MPLIALALTIFSQFIVALSFMLISGKNSFFLSLVSVLGIQISVWLLYSATSWVLFFVKIRSELINLYWHKFISHKFPRIYTRAGKMLNPEEYLRIIYSNEEFEPTLRLVACTMQTEISALDKLNNKQEKWRLQKSLDLSLKKYFKSRIASETYHVTEYGLMKA